MSNRALLVGINEYPNVPLKGCVNDVEDMGKFLVNKSGFDYSDISMLLDARATTAAIRDGLDWLIDGLKPGDRAVFHYSGHGSRVAIKDRSGSPQLHDVICPVDFDFTPAHWLSDEDLRQIFAALPPGVEFNWVSDSCHAGELARIMLETSWRSKFLPPPSDLAWGVMTALSRGMEPLGFARAIDHLNGALLAACRSDQTAADAFINGRPNGAHTYYLLDVLSASDGLAIPLTQVTSRTKDKAQAAGYVQEAQIRGEPRICEQPWLGTSRTARGTEPRPSHAKLILDLAGIDIASKQTVLASLDQIRSQIADAVIMADRNTHGRGCSFEIGAGPGGVHGGIVCSL